MKVEGPMLSTFNFHLQGYASVVTQTFAMTSHSSNDNGSEAAAASRSGRVASQRGEGTAERSAPSNPGAPATLRSILIVEDHKPTRIALQQLLAHRKFQVLVARTLAEALVLADRQPIDLVISDIELPDGDGYELIGRLQAVRPGLEGIAISGHGARADVARSRAAGFAEHLTKPVDIDALDRAVTQWRGGGRTSA